MWSDFGTCRCGGYDATAVDKNVDVLGRETNGAATVADSNNVPLTGLDHLVDETHGNSQSLGDFAYLRALDSFPCSLGYNQSPLPEQRV
jgi:hypothetical protein